MVNFMPPPRIVAVGFRAGSLFAPAECLVRFSNTPADSKLVPLFTYFADEVTWTEAELMGKTRDETEDLRYKKDMELLADF